MEVLADPERYEPYGAGDPAWAIAAQQGCPGQTPWVLSACFREVVRPGTASGIMLVRGAAALLGCLPLLAAFRLAPAGREKAPEATPSTSA